MCGIIGIIGKNKELNKRAFELLLVKSQIRGKHATGVSWVNEEGEILTRSEPIAAIPFVNSEFVPESKLMIGHVRYSTSSLNYNQPLQNNIALVHNGVITQSDPKNWSNEYGYKGFSTKNDSELLLKCIENGDDMFNKFPKASISCGYIDDRNRLFAIRNNSRPLWIFCIYSNDNAVIATGFASTLSIIERAMECLAEEYEGVFYSTMHTNPFCLYEFKRNTFTLDNTIYPSEKQFFQQDLQINTKIESKYV